MEKELRVSKIAEGTVIDHIDAGRALNVLKILGLSGSEGLTIAVVMNVPSKKLGKKDIVKVEGVELREDQVSKIALIAPSATINIVKNYEVVEKVKVNVPHVIEGLLKCVNPNCITSLPREPVKTKFKVLRVRPLNLICEYCGVELNQEDVITQLTGAKA
ncbi:MAG: aspartate carbamoyltransferase regulatory subunit [Thermofilaceae archaeon]|nr:aspartate carbamoyltransferase regulatory subunit [Thermofilaceae archaeon]MDW8004600.1 aspartate carbamoyltransferase regulatory subunit [Thermofilaceae archaeon]